jgi:hypothetical protein
MNRNMERFIRATAIFAMAGVLVFSPHALAQDRFAAGTIKVAEANPNEQKKKSGAAQRQNKSSQQTATPKRKAAPNQGGTPKQVNTPRPTSSEY